MRATVRVLRGLNALCGYSTNAVDGALQMAADEEAWALRQEFVQYLMQPHVKQRVVDAVRPDHHDSDSA